MIAPLLLAAAQVTTCTVAYAADADTLRCTDGRYIRLAGLTGLERDGSCNSPPDCAVMPFNQAKAVVHRIAAGKTYRFRIYGRSGKRPVGDNLALRCEILRSGAAVTWHRWQRDYARRFGMGECGR